MSILILTNSLLTSVQDLGRNGFRAFGINQNGAMDKTAVQILNILLRNNENEAVLEIHFPAPKILFEENAVIALGGADFAAKIDGKKIENWQPIWIKKSQTLTFAGKQKGNRLYLALQGGLDIDQWLESKSTNLKARHGGFQGRKLLENDRLFFKKKSLQIKDLKPLKLSPYFVPNYTNPPVIRIISGPEFDLLTPWSSESLLKNTYQITQNSDRMGFRFQGEPLFLLDEKELISSAVTFGTIQLLPTGQIIILMADHQTTGGYPRIGNVISVDLPILAQLGPNDKINFEIVSLKEAENLALKFEQDLDWLKTGVNFKYAFNYEIN